MSDDTIRRKDAHLDLCATEEVEPAGNETLFEDVSLVHEALPELSVAEVDLSTSFLGKRLRAPVLITGMSGGTDRAGALNRDLARVADELGVAFGVGSQRAMDRNPAVADSFRVRDGAPRVALLGNIGLWQAHALGVDGVRRLVDAIAADGIAVHLNAGQELIQPEGDRDFRQGFETVKALAAAFGDRLVVKETGCGIGPSTARRLFDAGVNTVDVSGLGGTSWVRVEALRAQSQQAALGQLYSGWGIPTAACVATVAALAKGRGRVIASGGMRDGLMAAKALALGASMVGFALPVFRAWTEGGIDGARRAVEELVGGLSLAMVLTGSRTVGELQSRPRIVTGRLKDWIAGLSDGAVH